MDSNPITKAFFASTFTEADARRRLNILDVVIEESLYSGQAEKPVEDVLKGKTYDEKDTKAIIVFLRDAKLPKDHAALKKVIKELTTAIEARPTVRLTVSFEPTDDQLEKIADWFRKNLNPEVLMSIVFSADVVGGASIAWQGKEVTYDLDYLVRSKRNEIVAVIDKYVAAKKKERII